MIKEVDAFQDGIVKSHLFTQVRTNTGHAKGLCWADNTKDYIRSGRTRTASLLSIEVNSTTLF